MELSRNSIRVASNRKIEKGNWYQLALQRDLFPNKFHKSLLWMSFRRSCNAMMLSICDITVWRISVYASGAIQYFRRSNTE